MTDHSRKTKDHSDVTLLALVVEDDLELFAVMRPVLEKLGFKVHHAKTAAEAYRHLANENIDLLLLDWRLNRFAFAPTEETTGQGILLKSKEMESLPIVVVISGVTDFDVRTDVIMQGAMSFLSKPFSTNMLESHIARWKQYRRASRPALPIPSSGSDIHPFADYKRKLIQHVVSLLDGNVTLAAEKLELHRHTISKMLSRGKPINKINNQQPILTCNT